MNTSAQISLFSRVTFLDKLLFTKHLSIMIKSGITIVESLEILTTQTKSPAFRKLISSVLDDIRNGKSLSGALEKHPHVFDTFYISIIGIGETSGTLDQSFLYLSQQLGKDYAFRKKIQGALMYPAIVFVAASVVGIGVSLFVLPKLLDLFKDFDAQLPLTTQILIFFANLMQDYGIFVFIWLVVVVVGSRFLVSLPSVKPLWHRMLLSLPIFGKIIQNASLTSSCRNLGVMLKSGLTITRALEIEANIIENQVFKAYFMKLLKAIDNGKSLAVELENGSYPYIPLIMTKMIAVGEKTGKLEETFLYLADFFEDEVDDETRNISTLLEPIMLLVIGTIVAFVALAIISPIYELTSSVNR